MSKFDDQVYDNISATLADGNEENHDKFLLKLKGN